jgi:hypothetical protein
MNLRKRLLADLDRDISEHIERETQDNIARGMSPDEARYAAVRKFGNVTRVKEDVREVWAAPWETQVANLLRDFRYALRNLRKDPKFTFVAVFALALGIGASTVVFSVFYNLLFNAFAAKDAGRLVVPVIEDAERPGTEDALTLPLTELDVIREQNHVFENIVGYVMAGGFVLANDGPQTYQFFCTHVTSDAFDFYGVPALLGRGIIPGDGQPGAAPVFVMSYRAWNGSFHGDPGILGKTLIVDGEPRTLVGVMLPRFQAFGTQAEIWIPLNRARDSGHRYADFPGELLARLKPGVTVQAASADLDVIVRNLAALHPKDFPLWFFFAISASDCASPSHQTPKFTARPCIHCTSASHVRIVPAQYCTLTVIHFHATIPRDSFGPARR